MGIGRRWHVRLIGELKGEKGGWEVTTYITKKRKLSETLSTALRQP